MYASWRRNVNDEVANYMRQHMKTMKELFFSGAERERGVTSGQQVQD